MRALEHHDLVFALGPAGTGKTYLAVAMARGAAEAGRIDRIILSRPAVEAGERLGFLPGDLKEKVDPLPAPALRRAPGHAARGQGGEADRDRRRSRSRHWPTCAVGRSSNAYVILDEAQNTTPSQMKMFLTRLGENSRMVITGDPTQSDLPPGMPSGLGDAVAKLRGLRAVSVVQFDKSDVVRHPLVSEIIKAYETAARPAAQAADGSAPSSRDGGGRSESMDSAQ